MSAALEGIVQVFSLFFIQVPALFIQHQFREAS